MAACRYLGAVRRTIKTGGAVSHDAQQGTLLQLQRGHHVTGPVLTDHCQRSRNHLASASLQRGDMEAAGMRRNPSLPFDLVHRLWCNRANPGRCGN